MSEAAEFVTRAVVFPLDVSPSEERLLLSYCGARRFAYNWRSPPFARTSPFAGLSVKPVYPRTS